MCLNSIVSLSSSREIKLLIVTPPACKSYRENMRESRWDFIQFVAKTCGQLKAAKIFRKLRRWRRLNVGEKLPPDPRGNLAEDLTGPLNRHLRHQGHGKSVQLLAEVSTSPLQEQGDTVHLAVITTRSSLHRATITHS